VIYVINGYNIRRRYIYLRMCKGDGTSRRWDMARAVDGALLKHVDSSLPEMVYRDRGKYIYTHINIEIERQRNRERVREAERDRDRLTDRVRERAHGIYILYERMFNDSRAFVTWLVYVHKI